MIAKIQKDALDDRDEVKDAICAFDKDGVGYLKREQVEKIIRDIGEPMADLEMNQMLDSMVYSLMDVLTLMLLLISYLMCRKTSMSAMSKSE